MTGPTYHDCYSSREQIHVEGMLKSSFLACNNLYSATGLPCNRSCFSAGYACDWLYLRAAQCQLLLDAGRDMLSYAPKANSQADFKQN